MMIFRSGFLAVLTVGLVLGPGLPPARAQHHGAGGQAPASPAQPGAHEAHRTPEGWKLAWPKGDPVKGREVFAKLECYSCHEVKGERFPAPKDPARVGPELSMMGPVHEPEYFVEAIVNPSATIEKGKGYQAPDGSSKMPSFNDVVTVQELIDLVAFLGSLKPPTASPPGQAGQSGSAPGQHGH